MPSSKSKFSPSTASSELRRARLASQNVYSEIVPPCTAPLTKTENNDCGNFRLKRRRKSRMCARARRGERPVRSVRKREWSGSAPNFMSKRRNVILHFGHCGKGAENGALKEGHFMAKTNSFSA